ncbi:MAG: sensor histidine kinase [Pseudobdellovibrionaceae bacterium]
MSYAITAVIGLVITTVLYLSKFADAWIRKVRGLPSRKPPKHWWFILSMCAMPLGLYIAALVMPVMGPLMGLGLITINADSFKNSVIIGGLIGSGFFALGAFVDTKRSLKQSELQFAELQNQHLKSQLSALTAQMNPHLLFNALNTVASLVATDPVKAEETIVTLSELYRGVLNSSKNMMHSLRSELDLCDSYLKIEKARFGDRIKAETIIDYSVLVETIQVPSLCLQPLVENAVKHGISKRAEGGRVQIRVYCVGDVLNIEVEDDGIGFNEDSEGFHGTGTGLANSRERIRLQYGDSGRFSIVSEGGKGTTVKIEISMSNEGGTHL